MRCHDTRTWRRNAVSFLGSPDPRVVKPRQGHTNPQPHRIEDSLKAYRTLKSTAMFEATSKFLKEPIGMNPKP